MYPPVVCCCGNASVGALQPLFKEMKRYKFEQHFKENKLNIAPDKIQVSDTVKIELRDVFEQLRIECQCCKARLLTQLEYKEFY